MVHQSIIEARLNQLGIKRSRWFQPEIRELSNILMDDEQIVTLVTGRYFGGFAMLVATDYRLLLIDKKVMFLTVDDIRYDMISEIDFNSRLFDATIHIYTVNKQHSFTSTRNKSLLRQLVVFIQQRISEIRHYQQQLPEAPEPERRIAPSPLQKAVANVSSHLPHHLPLPRHRPHHMPKNVGAIAMKGQWMYANPYTKNALLMRTRTYS